jgi:hypothetical protein
VVGAGRVDVVVGERVGEVEGVGMGMREVVGGVMGVNVAG